LVIILLLGAVTAFLIWNMNRRLKRLPATFGTDGASANDAAESAKDSAANSPSA